MVNQTAVDPLIADMVILTDLKLTGKEKEACSLASWAVEGRINRGRKPIRTQESMRPIGE